MTAQHVLQNLLCQKNQEVTVLLGSVKDLEKRLAAANQQLCAEQHRVRELGKALDEYEKTMACLCAEKEQRQRTMEQKVHAIARERDQQLKHLQTQELVFADLHRKYEKCKAVVDGLRKNEACLKESLDECSRHIDAQNRQYKQLREHVAEQLEGANIELEALRRAHAAEMAQLTGRLKRADVRVKCLEQNLALRTKENEELSHICDQLIAQTGSGNAC
ncbi:transforming acidic coiled-coil-containing protein 3-like isoform X2 [Bacillus rossius redtenbacheri]|uniref:transforming acidic coiled-coil-containing protein 3-like isoform X2 n=1 Tax=Bacillus rossius redtenbacheri TaxID=93214 RepID=UPI002FDE7811